MFEPKMIETSAAKLTNDKYCLFKSLHEGVICDIFEVSHYKSLGYTDNPGTFPKDSIDLSEEKKEVKIKRTRRINMLDSNTEEACDVVE